MQEGLLGSAGKRIAIAAGLATLGPALSAVSLTQLPKDLLERLMRYVEFFDRPAGPNIQATLESLAQIEFSDFDERIKILTPLTMDFELLAAHKTLAAQTKDLREQVRQRETLQSLTANRCLILNFLGIDFRRFQQRAAASVGEVLDEVISQTVGSCAALSESDLDDDDFTQLSERLNGSYVGIKLYPALGYDVWPADEAHRSIHVSLIQELALRGLPVTVHCQEGSFTAGPEFGSKKKLIDNAKPTKWEQLLERSGEAAMQLRLNLAHFGGEEGVAEVVEFSSADHRNRGAGSRRKKFFKRLDLRRGSWTTPVIRMLKRYSNTYSDLGAFDFEDDQAAAALLWILHEDATGELDSLGPHKLRDKLMWGTDIPMTLFHHESYKDQFDTFVKRTSKQGFSSREAKRWELPPSDSPAMSDHEGLLEDLVNRNPRRFLFGG